MAPGANSITDSTNLTARRSQPRRTLQNWDGVFKGCLAERKLRQCSAVFPHEKAESRGLPVRYSPKVGILTEQASGNHPAYSDTRAESLVLEIGNMLNPSESGRTLPSACHAPLTRDRDHRGCSECVRCVTLLLRYYRNAARRQQQPKRTPEAIDRPTRPTSRKFL